MRPRSARRGVAGHVDRAGVHRAAARSGHGGADLFPARLADDSSPGTRRAALAGRADQPQQQWFTARSRLVSMNGATPEDNGCGEDRPAACRSGLSCPATSTDLAADTLAWARHLIGYPIAGMLAAVVTTLRPADEIPDPLGGAAGPMTFLPAAIGGAPALGRPGRGGAADPCDVGQRPRRRANADLPARLGRPVPAPAVLSWAVLAPRIPRCMSPCGSELSWPAHRSRSPVRANAVSTVVSARHLPTRGRWRGRGRRSAGIPG